MKHRRAKVVYSYAPQNEDELKLEVDEVIEVLDEVEEGWWKGALNGHIGVFPSNFVVQITNNEVIINKSESSQSDHYHDIQSGDSITVVLQTIDEPVYTFFSTLRSNTNGSNAAPANPISNITNNALGYFSACGLRSKSIVVP